VGLIEIDMVDLEPPERGIDGIEDVLARQPPVVRPLAHLVVDLGRDDDFVALGEVLERAPQHLLADAERVDVGGVEEVDAVLERALDERPRRFLIEHPGRHFEVP